MSLRRDRLPNISRRNSNLRQSRQSGEQDRRNRFPAKGRRDDSEVKARAFKWDIAMAAYSSGFVVLERASTVGEMLAPETSKAHRVGMVNDRIRGPRETEAAGLP